MPDTPIYIPGGVLANPLDADDVIRVDRSGKTMYTRVEEFASDPAFAAQFAPFDTLFKFDPRPIPAVMSSPPTVTWSASEASTTISNPTTLSVFNGTPGSGTLNTHDAFTLSGLPFRYRSNGGGSAGPGYVSTGGNGGVGYVSGLFYGDSIEFVVWLGLTTGAINIWVDGERVNAAADAKTGLSAGGVYRILVEFGSVASREIVVALGTSVFFQGITYALTHSWKRRTNTDPFGLAVVGDSFVSGSTDFTEPSSWAARLRDVAQIDVNAHGYSGSGFVAGGGSSRPYAHADRLALVSENPPDVIVLQASTNDGGQSQATVEAAVEDTIAAYRAACPSALIICTGVFHPSADAYGALSGWVKGIADASADGYIDPLTETAGAWITGTGKSGATNGTGNADLFLANDGTHPTQAGADWIAVNVGQRLRSLLVA